MQLRVGDTVQWTSQSAGSTLTKVGEIIEVVPAAGRPKSMSANRSGAPRDHESYVVLASAIVDGKVRPRRRYWPRVSKLYPTSQRPEEGRGAGAGTDAPDRPASSGYAESALSQSSAGRSL